MVPMVPGGSPLERARRALLLMQRGGIANQVPPEAAHAIYRQLMKNMSTKAHAAGFMNSRQYLYNQVPRQGV